MACNKTYCHYINQVYANKEIDWNDLHKREYKNFRQLNAQIATSCKDLECFLNDSVEELMEVSNLYNQISRLFCSFRKKYYNLLGSIVYDPPKTVSDSCDCNCQAYIHRQIDKLRCFLDTQRFILKMFAKCSESIYRKNLNNMNDFIRFVESKSEEIVDSILGQLIMGQKCNNIDLQDVQALKDFLKQLRCTTKSYADKDNCKPKKVTLCTETCQDENFKSNCSPKKLTKCQIDDIIAVMNEDDAYTEDDKEEGDSKIRKDFVACPFGEISFDDCPTDFEEFEFIDELDDYNL